MTPEQVRKRNWQKFRLTAFGLDRSVLTPSEQAEYDQMMALHKSLVNNWQKNSAILSGKPLRYKCWCGKYTSVFRFDPETDHYLCKTHATRP